MTKGIFRNFVLECFCECFRSSIVIRLGGLTLDMRPLLGLIANCFLLANLVTVISYWLKSGIYSEFKCSPLPWLIIFHRYVLSSSARKFQLVKVSPSVATLPTVRLSTFSLRSSRKATRPPLLASVSSRRSPVMERIWRRKWRRNASVADHASSDHPCCWRRRAALQFASPQKPSGSLLRIHVFVTGKLMSNIRISWRRSSNLFNKEIQQIHWCWT